MSNKQTKKRLTPNSPLNVIIRQQNRIGWGDLTIFKSPALIIIINILASGADKKDIYQAGASTIAHRSGLSIKWVGNRLKLLEQFGFITWYRGGIDNHGNLINGHIQLHKLVFYSYLQATYDAIANRYTDNRLYWAILSYELKKAWPQNCTSPLIELARSNNLTIVKYSFKTSIGGHTPSPKTLAEAAAQRRRGQNILEYWMSQPPAAPPKRPPSRQDTTRPGTVPVPQPQPQHALASVNTQPQVVYQAICDRETVSSVPETGTHEQWIENQIQQAIKNKDFPRVTLLKQHQETGTPLDELEETQNQLFAQIRAKLWETRPELAPRNEEEKTWYLNQVNQPLTQRTPNPQHL